jgi:hypothetical protein
MLAAELADAQVALIKSRCEGDEKMALREAMMKYDDKATGCIDTNDV